MTELRLPLDVSEEKLCATIKKVQERARANLADPEVLAERVVCQLGRVLAMADALGLPIENLEPSGQFWTGSDQAVYNGSTITVVHVSGGHISVGRGHPWGSLSNGSMSLHLRP